MTAGQLPPAAESGGAWGRANQAALADALADVRSRLESYLADQGAALRPDGAPGEITESAEERQPPANSALGILSSAFSLSPFERAIVVLCAGVELDAALGALCAASHGDPHAATPTFGLALAALPGAHWSALTPGAPLRRWRLVEIGAGPTLAASPLRLDERVLHHLLGVAHLDERLVGLVEPAAAPEELLPSEEALAERMVRLWAGAHAAPVLPAVHLCSADKERARGVAAAACAHLGLALWCADAAALPADVRELDGLLRLWEREAILSGAALLLEADDGDPGERARGAALARAVDDLGGLVILSGRTPQRARRRALVRMDLPRPDAGELRAAWTRALPAEAAALNGDLDALAAQFTLGAAELRTVALEAAGGPAELALRDRLWQVCRVHARPRLDDLAQRIETRVGWDDLVLPDKQMQLLGEVAIHVRRRALVYDGWGFAAKNSRGLGVSALFSGASGTGKTLAAEVLANELRLDLYRIDLSQVVSKYIGETEKNLRRVFDAAEESGSVLLFDEADALFGKRSEVKDSHDRYANIEVSYLLQRMEAYRGLAILTSNLKNALDTAFLRRIRFVVQFPFPDAALRAEIWRRVFPVQTPTAGLNVARLAQLSVAGGNIRNIAMHGAFLAAEAGEPVGMAHLLRAAQVEYAKLEKPLTESDVSGWA